MSGALSKAKTTNAKDDEAVLGVVVLGAEEDWDDEEDLEVFELWAENAQIVDVFTALLPDWQEVVLETDKGLIIRRRAFRREAIEATMRMLRVKKKRRPDTLLGIRIMESAALAEFSRHH